MSGRRSPRSAPHPARRCCTTLTRASSSPTTTPTGSKIALPRPSPTGLASGNSSSAKSTRRVRLAQTPVLRVCCWALSRSPRRSPKRSSQATSVCTAPFFSNFHPPAWRVYFWGRTSDCFPRTPSGQTKPGTLTASSTAPSTSTASPRTPTSSRISPRRAPTSCRRLQTRPIAPSLASTGALATCRFPQATRAWASPRVCRTTRTRCPSAARTTCGTHGCSRTCISFGTVQLYVRP
mmetsp:Transcript_11632/g.38461  ORF Transcript_11632/g.38461 Transcript_11632/m.38461 type:complete len:236 (-) Transcript_11632:70-777(-)